MTPEQKAALRDEGVNDAYKFAEKTVDDTQFVYNKGARPNWARGAVGATLFTFKTFTVSMLEVIGKASPKAEALIGAALILVAGIKGLPFEEDAGDIIDTIGQALGYRTNSGKEIELAAYKLPARRSAACCCTVSPAQARRRSMSRSAWAWRTSSPVPASS